MPKIILASLSPRRKELLLNIVKKFGVIPSSFDESTIDPDGQKYSAAEFAILASLYKALDIAHKHPKALVIGADTVVALNGKIFGKPKDKKEAVKILQKLSGRKHQVTTGVSVIYLSQQKIISTATTSEVYFKKLKSKDILEYVESGSPLDKAGSYGIQDIGQKFVKKIEGDLDNIVGLPIKTLKKLMLQFQS